MPTISPRSSPSLGLLSPFPPEAKSSSFRLVNPNLLIAFPPSSFFYAFGRLATSPSDPPTVDLPPPPSPPSESPSTVDPPPPTSPPSPPSPSESPPTLPSPPSPSESPPTLPSPPLPGSSPHGSEPSPSGKSTGVVAGLSVGGVMAMLAVVGVILFVWHKKKRGSGDNASGNSNIKTSDPEAPNTNRDNRQNSQLQQWELKASSQGYEVPMLQKSSPPLEAESPQLLSPSYNSVSPTQISSSSGGSGSVRSVLGNQFKQSFSTKTFTFEELAAATNGFSEANLLGVGGFGYVYKGILPDGKEVAVKCLKAGSKQGDREFLAELEIISRINHKHLVSLVGYCIKMCERMVVYEFVPNKTLDFHLHEKDQSTLDWALRLKIAIGTAKGLAYLHEDCQPKIVHRDIKSTNILLDSKFEAKVADFGLAKFFPDTETHVLTRIMGTLGYLAPEYASSGKVTIKSDVYSFGVTLLDLITGYSPLHESRFDINVGFVDSVRPKLTQAIENGNYDAVVDPRLQKDYNATEMERMVACANACLRVEPKDRPLMSMIVHVLEGLKGVAELHVVHQIAESN
ncbi:PREDICTED: proline-rich receptor-like protein kinase PERK1 [Nelumbo nucifera]|uniref:non-specific serine/threonine protein kinase n=1 Tax=Nelumbo nucifera TaxID=4432 RepID=A0A1U8ARZ5_NELNU|nr:PREDICTED: proline-rich receptor-like protein kinase PERK1 [Nelumbo nucifera]